MFFIRYLTVSSFQSMSLVSLLWDAFILRHFSGHRKLLWGRTDWMAVEIRKFLHKRETCTFFSCLFFFHVRCVNSFMANAMNHLSEFSCNVSILEFCFITHGLSLDFSRKT